MGRHSRKRKACIENGQKGVEAAAERWEQLLSDARAASQRAAEQASVSASRARGACQSAAGAVAASRQLRSAAGELGPRGEARRAVAERRAEKETLRAAELEEQALDDEEEAERTEQLAAELEVQAVSNAEPPLRRCESPAPPISADWETSEPLPPPPARSCLAAWLGGWLPWPASPAPLLSCNPVRRPAVLLAACRQLQTVDLFSGIGGMARGLRGHVSRVRMYCECNAYAKELLKRAMAANLIDSAPIHDDIRTLAVLPAFRQLCQSIREAKQGLMFTAGWPCQGELCRASQLPR